MSGPFDRRGSPRRRIGRGVSRMHPGWKVFFQAWGSGIFTLSAALFCVEWMLGKVPWPYVGCTGLLALVLFYFGGRNAENLTDRKP